MLVCYGIMLEYLFGKIERFLTEDHCNLFKIKKKQANKEIEINKYVDSSSL